MLQLMPQDANPAAVILDVDGTLYHQRPLRIAMLLRLARAAARRPREMARASRVLRSYRTAQEVLRASADPDPLRQVDVAAAECGRPVAEVQALVEHWMEREPLAILPRYGRPGLRAFLERARARGVRLGVFSDYPAYAKLEALGVRDLFDAVLSAQDAGVGRFKPDPKGLLLVAEALRVRPADTVYVGDRADVDGEAARRAGMRCAIFTDPAAGALGWSAVAGFPQLGELLLGPASADGPPVIAPILRARS